MRKRVGALRRHQHPGAQRSQDGRAALIRFDIRGDSEKAVDKIVPIEAAVRAVADEHAGLRVEQFGDASSGKKFDDKLAQDFQKAEFLSIPITLLILLLAFGAMLAAGIPVLLGLTSVFTAFGLTAVSSQFMATGESTQILMMLIGMAVAVDYSLFYLKREREERARGAGKLAALEAAAATSGHAVLVSGLTVMASLAGIFFLGEPESGAMAIGSILVVGVAVLGSLTVLPAVLAKLGDRVHKSRLPLLRRLKREERDSRVWGFVLGHVMRRPVVALVAGVAVLVVLALPALGMHTKQTGTGRHLAQGLPGAQGLRPHPGVLPEREERGRGRHPGRDVTAPVVQAGIAELERQALATGKVSDRSPSRRSAATARSFTSTCRSSATARTASRWTPWPRCGGSRRRRIGTDPGRDGRRRRRRRGDQGRQRQPLDARAARVRLRARDGVPAAARHVPVDRDPDQGDPAQPAVRRGRLRRAHDGLPARPGARPSGCRTPRASPPGCRSSCS